MERLNSKDRIIHILQAIDAIHTFMQDIEEASFLHDLEKQSAVQYQFLIIGEAIKHIDISLLEKYDYPWHIPRSFRNFIIHEYHGIQMNRVFHATQDLVTLDKILKYILQHEF